MTDFIKPRKALGQNFLEDDNIIRKIVAALQLKAHDCILEIGPGRGALTRYLIDHVSKNDGELHLVEFDKDLIDYWQGQADQQPNLRVHGIDILKFDIAQNLGSINRPLKVIGNLPYNISSPVLFHLSRFSSQVDSQLVMLQKEVVERMVARPGNKQYGRLSVMLQYQYQLENLFTVPPAAFFPAPKVDSAIVRMTPKTEFTTTVDNMTDFELLVKAAFSMRRKTLRNNLKQLLSDEAIDTTGVDPKVRAETLENAEFVALANLYSRSSKFA